MNSSTSLSICAGLPARLNEVCIPGFTSCSGFQVGNKRPGYAPRAIWLSWLVLIWTGTISSAADYVILPSAEAPVAPQFADGDGNSISAFGVAATPSDSERGGLVTDFPVGGQGWLLVDPSVPRSLAGAVSISFWSRDVPGTGVFPVVTMTSGFDLNPPEPLYSRVAGESDTGARFVDLNSDGFMDLVRRFKPASGADQGSAWINTGSGWWDVPDYALPKTTGRYNVNADGGTFLDVDGDGLTDFLYNFESSAGVFDTGAWLNKSNGWVSSSAFSAPLPLGLGVAPKPWDYGTRAVDLNRDGMVDMIRSFKNGGVLTQGAFLNTGTGWQQISPWDLSPAAFGQDALRDRGTVMGDINGDGLTDIVSSFKDGSVVTTAIWLGKVSEDGTAFFEELDLALSPEFVPPQPLAVKGREVWATMVADVNADGILDILYSDYGVAGATAWLGSADGWQEDISFTPPIWIGLNRSSAKSGGKRLIDLDGDGRLDFFSSWYSDVSDVWTGDAYLNESDPGTDANGAALSHWVQTSLYDPVVSGTSAVISLAREIFPKNGTELIDVNGDGLPDAPQHLKISSTSFAKGLRLNNPNVELEEGVADTAKAWLQTQGSKPLITLGFENGSLVWKEYGASTTTPSLLVSVPGATNLSWQGAWNHWTVVKDATTDDPYTSAGVRIYRNGKLAASAAASSISLPSQDVDFNSALSGILVGRDVSTGRLVGKMHRFTIRDSALDAEEAMTAYRSEAVSDADQDGMDDFFELEIINANTGDILDDITDVLPGGDFDTDGRTNAEEFADKTNPTNATDFFVDATWGLVQQVVVTPPATPGNGSRIEADLGTAGYASSGAVSQKAASASATARFTIPVSIGEMAVGFSQIETSATWTPADMQFSLRRNALAGWEVYVGATKTASLSQTITSSTVIEIQRLAAKVSVTLDGEEVASANLTGGAALGFRVAFTGPGQALDHVRTNGFNLTAAPPAKDADGDDMDDDWEAAHNVDDPDLDPDGDGLTNLEEFRFGTDPNDADSDNDGLNDFLEYQSAQNANAGVNLDGDEMTDDWEWAYFGQIGRDGFDNDDTDLMLDVDEFNFGFNPTLNDTLTEGFLRVFQFDPNARLIESRRDGQGRAFAPDQEGNILSAQP